MREPIRSRPQLRVHRVLGVIACVAFASETSASGDRGAATPSGHVAAAGITGRVDVHPDIGADGVRARTVFVAVPADYDPDRRYPVLYMQDGQDLFDPALAPGGAEWGVDELLAANPPGIPPLLVVGIAAAADSRLEYAPPGAGGGRADTYTRFVVEVVKPYIDAHYATRSEPDWTWIGGAGGGGVAALYAAWTQPRVFGGAIAIGLPDLDVDAVAWVRTPLSHAGLRLWIDQDSNADIARNSTTQLLADLRRGARVHMGIAGPETPSLVRLGAALRVLAGP